MSIDGAEDASKKCIAARLMLALLGRVNCLPEKIMYRDAGAVCVAGWGTQLLLGSAHVI